ncbi:MAG TPA: ATP-binding protein [Nannocystaceae bacterium]|nr:ATP-binding protein [Nannocystaceae bacterium]
MTMRAWGWLEPELPAAAKDLSARTRARLRSGARLEILQRTYIGTLMYPLFVVAGGWLTGLTDDHPRGVAGLTAAFALVVAVRVVLYRRSIRDTSRASVAANMHLILGIATAMALAIAIGFAYVERAAESSVTAGFVVMAGIAGTVVMIANTHRRLATVWVLASIIPGMVVFTIEGGATSHVMLAMYVLYLPILRKMITAGHAAYWNAQVAAARLDEHAAEFARLARAAGMAENATNVLHDVGNALNVVKTSVACLMGVHDRHPAADMRRVVALLDEHAADLPRFLATDPRGAKLHPFLVALAESGTRHDELERGELARIEGQLHHIEAIVQRQQEIAGTCGAIEPCCVAELLTEAVGLSRVSRSPAETVVDARIDPALRVLVDRQRALRILVNLLDNAADATAGVAAGPRIELRATIESAATVLVEVADNGCGIPPAAAERIFTRGFTTKPHGHGFGLHGAFALAQSMGAALSCASEGEARGAVFRLRLPRVAIAAAA